MKRVLQLGVVLGALFCGTTLPAAVVDEYIFGFSPFGNQQLILNGSVIVSANAKGWYFETGSHDSTNLNYITGSCAACPPAGNYRSFFVFNVPAGITITSASISIGNPSNGYISPNPQDILSFWDVSTAISTLTGSQSNRTDIFNDLGSGVLFGSRSVDSSTNGTQVITSLNASALTALNAAIGQQIAFGGALTSAVPEPGTISLLALGLIGAMITNRRTRFCKTKD